jgi:hypothetical protein
MMMITNSTRPLCTPEQEQHYYQLFVQAAYIHEKILKY